MGLVVGMTITHHPDISTLMTCAAGSQPEALCAVVASHLSLCPECADQVGCLERVGTALFEQLRPEPMMQGVGAGAPAPQQTPSPLSWERAEGDIPGPLRCLLGDRLDGLAWQPLGPGIEVYEVPLSNAATGDLRLLRLAPGRQLNWRNEGGESLVIVFAGDYRNEQVTFSRGDVEEATEHGTHLIAAGPEQYCVVMIGSEAAPTPDAGWLGLLARLLRS